MIAEVAHFCPMSEGELGADVGGPKKIADDNLLFNARFNLYPSMSTLRTPLVAAWGQYLHWAHLQFEQFASVEAESPIPVQTAAAAHWLAAEYVALEGWKDLELSGDRVSCLLDLYPEHVETLRRCRNAVYHFQRYVLDKRIFKCLQNSEEELTWTIALHEEFQRFLVMYPYSLSGSFEDRAKLADELATYIGWFPEHTVTGAQFRIIRKCLKLESLLSNDHSQQGFERRSLARKTADDAMGIIADGHLRALRRWPSNREG